MKDNQIVNLFNAEILNAINVFHALSLGRTKRIKVRDESTENKLKWHKIVFDTGNEFSVPNTVYFGSSVNDKANEIAQKEHRPTGQKFWVFRKLI